MLQSEFEQRRAANMRALLPASKKPNIKVIDLVEKILYQNPSLPVVIQIGTQQFPIESVDVDDKNRVCINSSFSCVDLI
jgi:hypothetical protein